LTIKTSEDFCLLFRLYLFQTIMLVLPRRSFLPVNCHSISGNIVAATFFFVSLGYVCFC
jgi:hypothetical protein